MEVLNYGRDILEGIINFSIANPLIKIIRSVDVPGANGRYYVTPLGLVISLCRNRPLIMSGRDDGRGYLKIEIANKNYPIHRLVASAFFPRFDSKSEEVIHHIDRNSYNNDISNLVPLQRKRHRLIHTLLSKWDKMEIV